MHHPTGLRHAFRRGGLGWSALACAMISARSVFCFLLGCLQALRGPEPGPESFREPVEPSAQVRGPTERCRATYVFVGTAPAQAGASDAFRQREGVLRGIDFGACVLMGPTAREEWLWVLMPFEPGFRGTLYCELDEQRSPALEVTDPSAGLPDWIRGRYASMDPLQAAARIVPSSNDPCPDISLEDAEPPGPSFR